MIPYFSLPAVEKIQLFTSDQGQTVLQFLLVPVLKIGHMITYLLIAYLTIIKCSVDGVTKEFYGWQKLFIALFLLFILSSATYYLLVISIDFKIEYDYMISLTMAFAIYTIGYLGYRHPEIIHGFEIVKSKYENSSLKPEEAINLLEQITELLKYDKIYRRSDLKLPEVAKQLNISAHHLSQIVNEHLNLSFPDLINSYRVNEAKTMFG